MASNWAERIAELFFNDDGSCTETRRLAAMIHERVGPVVEAARNLLEQIVHDSTAYQAVWSLAASRDMTYNGPQYDIMPLAAALASLDNPPATKGADE